MQVLLFLTHLKLSQFAPKMKLLLGTDALEVRSVLSSEKGDPAECDTHVRTMQHNMLPSVTVCIIQECPACKISHR